MRLRVLAALVVGLALGAVPAGAEGELVQIKALPADGPPGTVVSITGVPPCGNAEAALYIYDGPGRSPFFARSQLDVPDGTYTIPNVPDGDYQITVLCPPGIEGVVPFQVISAPTALPAQPALAG
jgi:hypothetical protein